MSLTPLNAYVLVEVEPPTKTSYIDPRHLKQCLDMYFADTLDEVDLTRLWMRCEDLVPGNPLAGLLDSDTLRQCLFALPEPNRTAIALHYEPECRDLKAMLARWFFHTADQSKSFAEYQEELYCDGILMLAEVVHRAI